MEVSTTIELERCPICGGRAEFRKESPFDFYVHVKCTKCYARIASEYTEEEAARRWNRRTNK